MKYTQIPTNTFKELQMNAGILVKNFDPATGEATDLLGATTGGINFTDTPEYVDFAEDIDNAPKNMKEFKQLDNREVKIGGTFVSVSASTAKMLVAVGDVDEENENHIIPRNDLLQTDFTDLWWIGDYSDVNTGENAGYIAIHLFNALNTSGFQIQSTDKGKGQFAFEFTGHYSVEDQDKVPYEMYIKGGSDSSTTASITLDKDTLSLTVGDDATLAATVVPTGTAVTWTSSDDEIATVENGVVTAVAEGTATITAKITVESTDYTDTCSVTVTE